MSKHFVDIILPYKIEMLTYELPDNFLSRIVVGHRVLVSVGKRKLRSGIIAKIHNIQPEFETKSIISILDENPVVFPETIEFWQWIANYYICTIGEVMNAALPSLLKLEDSTKIYAPEFDDFYGFSAQEELIIRFVFENKLISISDLEKSFKGKNIYTLVQSLIERKNLFIYEELKSSYSSLKIKHVRLSDNYTSNKSIEFFIAKNQRGKKQNECIAQFLKLADNDLHTSIQKSNLLGSDGISRSAYNALLAKEIFIETEQIQSRISVQDNSSESLNILNEYQKKAYFEVNEGFSERKVVLLHGVTSSGKTEVYIHLIKDAFDNNKQVLYLLPEIGLTNQIIARLNKHFGSKVAVYHSGLSASEKFEIWQSLLNNSSDSVKLVLGVRSSIFLPFSNLALIIVDEEHETTFKQTEPSPRYQARDLAVVWAQKINANILLGSATPSVESYFNAQTGKYKLVEILQRHNSVKLPHVEIVDMKLLQNKLKNSILSKVLIKHIESALDKKEQVILFRNRRGFAPILQCASCGNIPKCKNCDVSMTYHKNSNQLVCHYCGYAKKNTSKCDDCGQTDIRTLGFGTEKLEEEISQYFIHAKVARMDTDTMRIKNAYSKLISEFEQGSLDILVGTQILAKGLDFKNVNTVGVLNVDALMNIPDFRSNERAFQLLTQVSGRAGRHSGNGKVLLQTLNTDTPLLKFVQNTEYKQFFNQELSERKGFYYPPFSRLIKITLRHKEKNKVEALASYLMKLFREKNGIIALGPIYPYIAKVHNKVNLQILLKLSRDRTLIDNKLWIKKVFQKNVKLSDYKSVQVLIDVDPYN